LQGKGSANTESETARDPFQRLPILSSTTPKVSILTIGNRTLESANELVKEATDQRRKFGDLADSKAFFMVKNYQSIAGGG
tara:strand:- start:713 stop:955 length:243 start_codon:yes stop_codon:yes gene_type:complete